MRKFIFLLLAVIMIIFIMAACADEREINTEIFSVTSEKIEISESGDNSENDDQEFDIQITSEREMTTGTAEAKDIVPQTPATATAETTKAPVWTEKKTTYGTTVATTANTTTGSTGADILDIEREVVTLVNEIRIQNGLIALTLNGDLSYVARVKAKDMAENKYLSHTSPTYGSPFDMMTHFGISYSTAGENIAMGYSSAKAVVDGWMNSEGHRANILNPSFRQIGVGYSANGNYWAQMFIG